MINMQDKANTEFNQDPCGVRIMDMKRYLIVTVFSLAASLLVIAYGVYVYTPLFIEKLECETLTGFDCYFVALAVV